ncbi:MAG TPA: hypothetical protein H9694_09375, partial [Firmicutes bacterium]|nr:hypothetical protein [Bacillota bacterium]
MNRSNPKKDQANRKQRNQEIERRLADEVRAATPDVMQEVLAASRTAVGMGNVTEITAAKRPRRLWRGLAATAAAI